MKLNSKYLFLNLVVVFSSMTLNAQEEAKKDLKHIAPKPLYRDPIFDGAADPTIVWNKKEKLWFMFYTNRRANDVTAKGITWVHGTKIGIAVSKDGSKWTYKDTCNINYKLKDITYWAPDVIEYNNKYHMYLTIVPGIFNDWYHPRSIIHLTSSNLMDWKFESELKLASERCIDASVFRLPNGTWRMFYNNENDGKSIYYADSNDLYNWKDSGTKIIKDRGEGPKVFVWKGKNWMISDSWRGLNVYSSEDFLNWNRQEKNILQLPGTGQDDKVIGGHADVVVNDGKAYIFYFTHPGRTPENKGIDSYETKRSSIQVAELEYHNGEISCNRDKSVQINLKH
ncbi:family 43 glycosylhydrolase [Flavobacterium quisquiliarum]|uniref:Family 43 glycosylhydrolase n=1 Tax=Flavobacterium quisquiliarum TaxID=1834436 RepID=A0ABV8W2F4_9FLAO|nr:family 43 glycosylhydrolase [Flavobacterium quisquiliarum]MBW1655583.1 family 43 glycosylhydrolase [Flavobacterium quisquiliarum]NWL03207.1 glycosyl hydrolase [Flavobacterium collinsii]